MKEYSLNALHVGNTARVTTLLATGSMRRRLLDIGLTEGTEATCLYASPFGDPRAYFIRGTVIALRAEDASLIAVDGIV